MPQCSMLEIYNEEIRDLLGNDPKAKLGLREEKGAGVYVAGLSQFVAKSPEVTPRAATPLADVSLMGFFLQRNQGRIPHYDGIYSGHYTASQARVSSLFPGLISLGY